MSLLISFLFTLAAHADAPVEIQKPTAVYQRPAFDAQVSFNLRKGEKVQTAPSETPEFLLVKVKRRGKIYQGYAARVDISGEKLPESARSRGDWGIGAGGVYTSLTQGAKSFETEDQVQYTTTSYKSSGMAPVLVAQLHDQDFWRLTVGLKKTHYQGTAVTNVSGSTPQAVDLRQQFFSGLLQRAWMPFTSKTFYLGAGVEVAKATSMELKLGSSTLPTASSDYPLYVGGLAFAGSSLSFNRFLSLFAEARYEYIANQTPSISGFEASLGLMYWP